MGNWQMVDEGFDEGLDGGYEIYLRETVLRAGERWDVPLSDEKISMLEEQLRWVLEENRELNLTAVRNPRKAVLKHVVDSMSLYSAYASHEGRYLDMGTGAGYPGMVLEILKSREGVLLDSVRKKIEACRRIGNRLGIEHVRYVAERVESYALEEPESFGVASARAVAPIGVLLEYAQPLLEQDGVLVLSKGVPDDEEVTQGERVAGMIGMEGVSRETIELPEGAGTRTIFVYAKTGPSSVQLPRRIGRAMKQPLWKRVKA